MAACLSTLSVLVLIIVLCGCSIALVLLRLWICRLKRTLRKIRLLAINGIWRSPGGEKYGPLANIFASIVAAVDAAVGREDGLDATKEHGDG